MVHFLYFRPLPEGYIYCNIKEECTEQINREWEFGGTPESLELIKMNLRNQKSTGISDKDGNLVAYGLQQEYGSLGMLYVNPEHRRKGLAKSVLSSQVNKVMKTGEPVFCHIVKDNTTSFQLHKDAGFNVIEGCDVIWVRFVKAGQKSCKEKGVCCT